MRSRSLKPRGQRTKQRPVSIAAREAILNAAEAEFAARGFGGARAQSIAARAGVNKALPFYHFGSKAELYDEVVKRAMTRLAELMAYAVEQPSPKQSLATFIHRFSSYLASNSNWPLLIFRELMDERSQAREVASQYLKPLVDNGRELLERQMADGRLGKVEPLQMMISIMAEVLGYFLLLPFLEGIGMPDPLSPANLAAREQMVIDLLARGLGMSEAAQPQLRS